MMPLEFDNSDMGVKGNNWKRIYKILRSVKLRNNVS